MSLKPGKQHTPNPALAKACGLGSIQPGIAKEEMVKEPGKRQQTIRCNLKWISMSVGYRAQDVTGSDIALGANHG